MTERIDRQVQDGTSDMISIRGQVIEKMYIPKGIKRELVIRLVLGAGYGVHVHSNRN